MDLEEVLAAWRANNALNLEVLDFVGEEAMDLKPVKGKTVRSNFTHIVSVRAMWTEGAAKKSGVQVPKLDWKSAGKEEIRAALALTSSLLESEFSRKHASPGKGAWTLPLSLCYMVAHEAHHRSQIEIACRLGGREFPDEFGFGLWDWTKKG